MPRCSSCLTYVGEGTDNPATTRTYVDEDGSNARPLTYCDDKEACERRWAARNAPDPWAEPKGEGEDEA